MVFVKDIDVALAALADPTRRKVVERLADGPRRTNELADDVGVSVPAVSRHLRLLRDRGLVDRTDVDGDGRGRQYELVPAALTVVAEWLSADHWTNELSAVGSNPDEQEYLARVGGFLDAFAASDASFFERHLADDVELVFPGSAMRWTKQQTVDSVGGHAPYVEWSVSEFGVRPLGGAITLVVATVVVRTTISSAASSVVQTMVFDDSRTPWALRFLQQTPVDRPEQ